jgi:hypothetical protein
MAHQRRRNTSPEAALQPPGFMIKTHSARFECAVAHFT